MAYHLRVVECSTQDSDYKFECNIKEPATIEVFRVLLNKQSSRIARTFCRNDVELRAGHESALISLSLPQNLRVFGDSTACFLDFDAVSKIKLLGNVRVCDFYILLKFEY